MGLKFSFKENKGGDESNIQICYEGKNDGLNIANYQGMVLQLSDNIARNIMFILDSEQEIILPNQGGYLFKGKFEDCHSFSYMLGVGKLLPFQGVPSNRLFKREGLEYVGDIIKGDNLNQLKQGDILTPLDTVKNSHSIVYLGEKLFINCLGKDGYVDCDGNWFKKIDMDILKGLLINKSGKKQLKDGYRKGGRISINTIDEIFEVYNEIQSFFIYRKNFLNTQSPY